MTTTQKLADMADRLKAGATINIYTNMGSCQCGSTCGTLRVDDGVLMAECGGTERWQRYAGPASGCQVHYGWGATARALAARIAGQLDEQAERYALSQRTGEST